MPNARHVLHPLLLAALDIALGVLLYLEVASPLGVVVVAAGLLVVGAVVSQGVQRANTAVYRLVAGS
jgi:hypothetical protein